MAVIFPRWTNKIPMFIGAVVPMVLVGVIFAVWYWFSPWYTDVGYQPEQPIEFSHELHAGELGMDCRYCHNTVERAGHAAIPPTNTCNGCHSVIRTESRTLEPIRRSARTNTPIYQPAPNDPTEAEAYGWVRVHMLPDYAYFDHSVHLSAGVGCVECHGRVDQMARVRQVEPLSMGWCLECHRDPEPRLRPRTDLTDLSYEGEERDYDYLSPATPEWGCQSNADCPSGFCRMESEGDGAAGVCVGRKVNPPINCSGCHR